MNFSQDPKTIYVIRSAMILDIISRLSESERNLLAKTLATIPGMQVAPDTRSGESGEKPGILLQKEEESKWKTN